jgi:hypothetical protein
MSRFEKGLPMKLDAEGNLDTGHLAKELKAALEYDVHYKQQDNMKKKAVKTSGTYDDFKAMVACAHLKTLTSKEVESLSAKKTGWQREFQSSSASDAHILAQEAKKSGIAQAKSLAQSTSGAMAAAAVESFRMPKNLVMLEGDMVRTLRNRESRMAYLQVLGLKRLKLLLKGDKDCTPELLEALLDTVMHAAEVEAAMREVLVETETEAQTETQTQTSTAGAEPAESVFSTTTNTAAATVGEGSADAETTPQSEAPSSSAAEKEKKMDIYKWLKAVSSFPRFFITVLFVPKPLIAAAAEYLSAFEVSKKGTEEETLVAETQRQEVLSRFLPKPK